MVSNFLKRSSAVAVLVSVLGYPPVAMAGRQLQPAGDFGFRFEVGDCLTEQFDSFSGVFSKNLGGSPAEAVNHIESFRTVLK